MKNWKFTLYIAAIVVVLSSILTISRANAQVYGEVSLDLFYDELSPYGNWDVDPTYGDIWYPNAGRDFRPYSSNGYWTMTEYGNTWVSNYSWGWAPFHYGRWVYTSYGWGWIPGYEWGPAWVEWRSGNGYYGWAPMMPRSGVSISINIPISAWVFAPVRYIYSSNFHRYAYYGRSNIYNRTTIIHNTYVVNNRHYYGGPARRDIERSLGRRIEVRNVRYADRPGASRIDKRSVAIYRPEMDRSRSTVSRSVDNRKSSNREVTNNRNTSNNRAAQREMHIDNKGNVTYRNGNNKTNDRAIKNNEVRSNNQRGNLENNNRVQRPQNREAANAVRNKAVQQGQRQNQNNRGTIDRSANNNRQVERQQPQRVERAQAQRAERTAPQRESKTMDRAVRNSSPAMRSSNSGSRVERSAAHRVERSAPSNNRNVGNTSRGSNGNHSERGRR